MQDAPVSEAALILAGLDWRVGQEPIYLEGGELIPGYVANIRDFDRQPLGVVSDRYRPVQNQEAFDFTDALLNSGDVRYETAGSLHNGRVVWLLARLEQERYILGDEVAPYLLFVNGHDGKTAVRVCMTPVRVVCANTLNMALHRADRHVDRSWSANHIGDVKGKMQEAKRTLKLATDYLDELSALASDLVSIKIGDTEWKSIVAKLIPLDLDKPEISIRKIDNVETLRRDLIHRIEAPDLSNFNQTGWGVVNAVADHVAHVSPLNKVQQRGQGISASRFEVISGGHPMLDRALSLVMALR